MKRWFVVTSPLAVASMVLAGCGAGGAATTTKAQDLVVTAAVRTSIFDALAKSHQLPPKDYVSLIPKRTYYAFNPANRTYYAAAGLVASPHSLPAQVGTQDDGGYQLLTHKSGVATWKVYNDGLGGAEGSTCPIAIPASVLAAWNWKPKSCAPPN
jgi:hypothetical protein